MNHSFLKNRIFALLLTVILLGLPSLIIGVFGFLLYACTSITAILLGIIEYYGWLILIIAEMALISAGPANHHTANDNTSGVTTLLHTMQTLPADLRGEVAFIFFDLEEMGLFGSAGYANKHKDIRKNTLLLNFDCVSDGNTILFAVRKGAQAHTSALKAAFPATDTYRVEVVSKGVFYPSDQGNFVRGVGVAALKTSKRGLLYMDRIHTLNDTVYEEGNIAYLTEGAIRLAAHLSQPLSQ